MIKKRKQTQQNQKNTTKVYLLTSQSVHFLHMVNLESGKKSFIQVHSWEGVWSLFHGSRVYCLCFCAHCLWPNCCTTWAHGVFGCCMYWCVSFSFQTVHSGAYRHLLTSTPSHVQSWLRSSQPIQTCPQEAFYLSTSVPTACIFCKFS